MTSPSRSLAARERAGLADLLAERGPDAPTCCAGWSAAHLAAHLVIRDRRPDALPGLGVEQLGLARPLTDWTHRLEDRLRASTPYPDLVARIRSGPPAWSPMAWPLLADLLNTAEFAIHHEDVRRARPGWAPRTLDRPDADRLWQAATLFAAQRPGGAVLRRSDVPGVEKRVREGGTAVTGEPLELLLWASGRAGVARVEVS